MKETAENPEQGEKPQQEPERNPKRRRWRRVLAFAGAGIAVFLILFFGFRDFVIRHTIIQGGSWLLGVPVTVESFATYPILGKVEIRNLRIANPEGYKEPYAFSCQLVRVRIKTLSLLTDMIEIPEVTVTGLRVNYEPGLQSANLTDLQKNISARIGAAENQEAETQKPARGGKALLIRKLDVSDSKLSFSNSALNLTQEIVMPPVHLTDVGGRETSFRDVFAELYGQLLGLVSGASAGFGESISAGMQKMLSGGSDFVDKSGDVFSKAGNSIKRFFRGGK